VQWCVVLFGVQCCIFLCSVVLLCATRSIHADGIQWATSQPGEEDPEPDAASNLPSFFDEQTVEEILRVSRQRGGLGSPNHGRGKRRRVLTSRMASSGLSIARNFTGASPRDAPCILFCDDVYFTTMHATRRFKARFRSSM
jgi:hypothetical protein